MIRWNLFLSFVLRFASFVITVAATGFPFENALVYMDSSVIFISNKLNVDIIFFVYKQLISDTISTCVTPWPRPRPHTRMQQLQRLVVIIIINEQER